MLILLRYALCPKHFAYTPHLVFISAKIYFPLCFYFTSSHFPDTNIEIFEKRLILFKFKEEENIALPLHFVQPQEYIEYFEDSAKLHCVQNLSLTQAL